MFSQNSSLRRHLTCVRFSPALFYIYIYFFLASPLRTNAGGRAERRRRSDSMDLVWVPAGNELDVSSGRLQKSVKCAQRAPLISDKCARLSGKEALTQIASSFELKPHTLAPHKAPSVRRALHQCCVCLPVWFARLVFIL